MSTNDEVLQLEIGSHPNWRDVSIELTLFYQFQYGVLGTEQTIK